MTAKGHLFRWQSVAQPPAEPDQAGLPAASVLRRLAPGDSVAWFLPVSLRAGELARKWRALSALPVFVLSGPAAAPAGPDHAQDAPDVAAVLLRAGVPSGQPAALIVEWRGGEAGPSSWALDRALAAWCRDTNSLVLSLHPVPSPLAGFLRALSACSAVVSPQSDLPLCSLIREEDCRKGAALRLEDSSLDEVVAALDRHSHLFCRRCSPGCSVPNFALGLLDSANSTLASVLQDRRRLEHFTEFLNHTLRLFGHVAWTLDLSTGKLTYVSPNALGILGRSAEEFLADPDLWFNQLHPEDRQQFDSTFPRALSPGHHTFCYRILRPGGEVRWIRDKLFVQSAGRDQPQTISGLAEDITESIHLRSELERSRRFGKAIVSALPDLVFQLSPEGRFLDYFPTPHIEPLLPPAEFLGKTVREVLPARIADDCMAAIEQALATGEVQLLNYTLDRHGATEHFECRISSSGGSNILAIIRDVSETRRQQSLLARKEQILQAISFGAERFLRHGGDPAADIEAFLEQLGRAAGVQRTYVADLEPGPDGQIRANLRHEWTAPPFQSRTADPRFHGLPAGSGPFHRWYHALARGESIASPVSSLPAEERPIFEQQQIRSLLLAPIFSDTRLTGAIGLDDCTAGREWSSSELESLRTAASILGAAITSARLRREREAGAARLRESGERYRLLFEGERDAILIFDPRDGRIFDANPACLRQYGFDYGELIGRNFHSLRTPEQEDFSLVSAGQEQPGALLQSHRRKDGSVFTAEVTLGEFAWHSGESCCAIVRDVTGRIESERRLQRKDRFLQALASASATLLSEESLPSALDQVVATLARALDSDLVTLRRLAFDEQRGGMVLVCEAHWSRQPHTLDTLPIPVSPADPGFPVLLGSGPISPAPLTFNIHDESTPQRLRDIFIPRGLTILTIVPILVEGQPWGILNIADRAPEGPLRTADHSLLQTAAAAIGSAVERHATQERVGIQRDILHLLSSSPGADSSLRTALDRLSAFSGLECCSLLLTDLDSGYLRPTFTGGSCICGCDAISAFAPDSALTTAVGGGQPLYAGPDRIPLLIPHLPPDSSPRTLACIPMLQYGRLFGAFLLHSRRAVHLSAALLNSLENIVAALSGALQNHLSQQRLQGIFSAVSEMVIVAGRTGRILHVNQAAVDQLGYSEAELLDKHLGDIHPGESLPLLQQEILRALEQRSITTNVPLRRSNGLPLPVETRVTVTTWGGTDIFIGVSRDISERLQKEGQLRLLEKAVAASGTGIAVVDACAPDCPAILANEALGQMLGSPLGDLLGRQIHSILGLPPAEIRSILDKLRAGEELVELMLQPVVKGQCRWISAEFSSIRSASGAPLYLVSSFQDVTGIKQAESELKSALEKEKELGELKSRFVSMTSHNFRTPLAVILSSAELLERYWQRWSDEKRTHHLHQIQDAVEHMQQMLNDVLTIGRTEAGAIEVLPRELDLHSLLSTIVDETVATSEDRLRCILVSPDHPIRVRLDPKLARQVFDNLVSNALKYSTAPSEVVISILEFDRGVEVIVEDHGIGIPATELEHIFRPFHRARNVGQIHGTGLGLAITHKTLEIMGGSLTINSAEGRGTRVSVRLPLSTG